MPLCGLRIVAAIGVQGVAQDATAFGGRPPATRVPDFGDQAAHVEAFQHAPRRGAFPPERGPYMMRPVQPGKSVFGLHLIGIRGTRITLFDNWVDSRRAVDGLTNEQATQAAVKKDLARVGIPYETDEGVADFHAAGRHTYFTELLRNGGVAAGSEGTCPTRGREDDDALHAHWPGRPVEGCYWAAFARGGAEPGTLGLGRESEGNAVQMRCIFCSAAGHQLTSHDAGEAAESNENPGVSRGCVATCHQAALVDKVEAPGIEPGSRRSLVVASTCVAFLW